jgi:cytochrome P450
VHGALLLREGPLKIAMGSFAESITVEDLERDPYPIFARLRAEEPVAWVPAVNCWLVTRAAEVEVVCTRTEWFTAQAPDSPVDISFGGRTLMTMDGDEHLELRRSLDAKFRPRVVATYIDDLVTPITQQYLEQLLTKPVRTAELMSEYFEPISVLSLGRVLGLGHLSAQTLQDWFHGLAMGATNFEQDPGKQAISDTTAAQIDAQLRPLMTRLQTEPDDSTIAAMLTSGCPVGSFRSIEQVMPSLKVILLGGMQEPGHGAGACLAALLLHPEQFAWLRAHPQHWDDAVHEALRWIAPIGTQQATAVVDVELAGRLIPQGDLVSAVVSSACHDESLFTEPGRFDIHRPRRPNAAFGYGPHFCAGHQFARDLERISLSMLVEALPDLELTQPVEFRGWEFRAPTALHVRW